MSQSNTPKQIYDASIGKWRERTEADTKYGNDLANAAKGVQPPTGKQSNTPQSELEDHPVRSQQTKEAFIKYLEEHPYERFWQAVRNFSGYSFVSVGNDLTEEMEDSFYKEEL